MMDVTAFLANSTKCDTWSKIKASHKGPYINDVHIVIADKKYVMRGWENFFHFDQYQMHADIEWSGEELKSQKIL